MYGAIENLLKLNLIEEIQVDLIVAKTAKTPLRDFYPLCDDEAIVFRSSFLFD